jgi:hypothetical protein
LIKYNNPFCISLLDFFGDALWHQFVPAFDACDAESSFYDQLFHFRIDIDAFDFLIVFEIIDDVAALIARQAVVGDQLIDLDRVGFLPCLFIFLPIEFAVARRFFCSCLLCFEFVFVDKEIFFRMLLLSVSALVLLRFLHLFFGDQASFQQLLLERVTHLLLSLMSGVICSEYLKVCLNGEG